MPQSNSMFRERRTLRILYVLAVYVLFQLSWWGYHLIQLNIELYEMKTLVLGMNQYHTLMPKIWMVIGEGSVFFILLALGFWYIKRTVSRELRLARMEKTFLLSVTHELKTPISTIKLSLETMKTRSLTAEQSGEILKQAIQETKRLQSLTENILLATRLDQKSGMYLQQKFDFSELINREISRFVSVFNANIQSKIQQDVQFRGDEQMLSALVVNLIENAIKYSPVSSDIEVALNQNDSSIVFEVSDKGVGIDENEKRKIFDKFYRIGNEETRTTKGTGLGLYIARNIATMHNGEISVKSNSPVGSVFTVKFDYRNEK